MRLLPGTSALALVALALTISVVWGPVAAGQESADLDSGGLGLTRAGWESIYGVGAEVDIVSPIYNELFEYQFQHGMMYVSFAGSKSEADSVVMYLEVAFLADGVPSEDARAFVDALIPSDAQVIDPFFAPPTPGAPSALSSFRYESEGLGTVPYGTQTLSSSFLVIYVEQYVETRVEGDGVASGSIEALVTRASIVAAIPVG